jgi:hypothetical protein
VKGTSRQISAELIKGRGKALRAGTYKSIHSNWNKKE